MAAKYKIKDFAFTNRKIDRVPQLSVSSVPEWKEVVRKESDKRGMSISHFVRQCIGYCVVNEIIDSKSKYNLIDDEE